MIKYKTSTYNIHWQVSSNILLW